MVKLGIIDALGSQIEKILKYSQLYFDDELVLENEELFRVVIKEDWVIITKIMNRNLFHQLLLPEKGDYFSGGFVHKERRILES